jgi:cytochrome P450
VGRAGEDTEPPPGGPPRYDVDLYHDDVLADPYPHYAALRDAGSAVWLPRHGLWAIPRFDGVRHALRNVAVFSSASGVAANDTVNALSAGTTLASDPPLHEALRRIVVAPLRPMALAEIRPRIEAEAEALVERLVARGRFDAVTDLAQHLPLSIVSDLVGLPEAGRERMLDWAAATFDVLGVLNERGSRALGVVQAMREYVVTEAVPGKLRPDSWGQRIYDAADRGEVEPERCPVLMRDYLGPSLDTTIFAIANLMLLFGRNPDQWDVLRSDPALVPNAVNEALRVESPIRGFTRSVTRDVTMDGITLPAGSRALLLYASANRDERKWTEPDRFDITRRNADQLGFGHGIHLCAGMHLARLEMHAILSALVARVRRFEVGEPVRSLNNVLRGLARLDVVIH